MEDYNPFENKPPAIKDPKEFFQEEVKSARNGLAVLLLLSLIGGRIIQGMSRLPGTSGPVMTIFTMLSYLPFMIYYDERAAELDEDPINSAGFAIVFGVLFLLHAMATTVQSFRGPRVGPYEMGQGFLGRLFPRMNPYLAGLFSDALVGLGLFVLFREMDCPIQAEYFLLITFWCLFTQTAWILRQFYYECRIREARKRAVQYSMSMRRR